MAVVAVAVAPAATRVAVVVAAAAAAVVAAVAAAGTTAAGCPTIRSPGLGSAPLACNQR